MRRFGLLVLFVAAAAQVLPSACSKERTSAPPRSIAARPAIGRVIVLGFDGLEPSLVEKWVAEGDLPNFERIIDSGAFGPLFTVLPSSSPPAWCSAVTGVNPGKHGVYGFSANALPGFPGQEAKKDADGPAGPIFYTSRSRGFQAVWDVLGRSGRRSTLVNIPLTSPADSLNGIMISGFPYASEDTSTFYWPKQVAKYLGDYAFDTSARPVDRAHEKEFLSEIDSVSQKRQRLGLTLFDAGDWDLFWLVFTFPDRYQHHFWKYMDKSHPLYDAAGGRLYDRAIESAYRMADGYLGDFMKRMRDTDLLIVMSDHGFGSVEYPINTQNFLFRTLGPVPEVKCTDYFGATFQIDTSGPGGEEKYASLRNTLVKGLLELKDPVRGVQVVDSVYLKEEIYRGHYVGTAPDVVGIEAAGYLFWTNPRTPDLRLIDTGPKSSQILSGFHKRRGVLALYGKNIKGGVAAEARIVDIAAIILAYQGVPAPAEIDGHLPAGVFTEDITQQIDLVKSADSGYRTPKTLADQDTKAMKKQLRAVGYIQ